MKDINLNADFVQQFEAQLDPEHPENHPIPTKVLGHGEISTVLEILTPDTEELAFKRMPMFRSVGEIERFRTHYDDAIRVLQDDIGIHVVPGTLVPVINPQASYQSLYIIQRKMPKDSIGNRIIHLLPSPEINRLLMAVLEETKKVFDFNRQNKGKVEVGFDGQISNWAVVGFDPEKGKLDDKIMLAYFDTSSPLLRRNGKEQLDPELFLRSAPSFMVWIIRLLFLQDVLTRYYDFRKVLIDLIANFYKEQRPDLIPELINTVNVFLEEKCQSHEIEPISIKEVEDYYKEDKLIWNVYLSFRKIDRFLYRLIGREYPYLLPENIKR